jgi:hypothetical protein
MHDSDTPSLMQEWELWYLLCKARRLRDTALVQMQMQAPATIITASSVAPAYVARRLEEGGELPEVEEVGGGGWQAGGGDEGDALEAEAALRTAVVRHVVEGLRGELVRELVEVVGL